MPEIVIAFRIQKNSLGVKSMFEFCIGLAKLCHVSCNSSSFEIKCSQTINYKQKEISF